MDSDVAEAGDVTATYSETEAERQLTFRRGAGGDELERYYGFDMALDHAAELLGIDPGDLPVPAAAEDMGM